MKIASLKQRIQELEFLQLQQDSPAEEAKTESNVWDDGSEDVNPFGGGNPGFHDDHYDNSLLIKETESEPIIWDIGDEEEDYNFVNNYLSFQEEPIVLVEKESCPVYDTDNEEEESMSVYDTDIEDVNEEEEGFVRKGGFGGEEDNIEDVVLVANDLCSSMIQTIEKSDTKITAASEKKDRQNLAKAQAKRVGEVTPLLHASPNPADETVGSVPKHVAATFATGPQTANPDNVVNLSENTCIPTPLTIVQSSPHANHGGSQEHAAFSDACKEMITHLATPAEDEFLGCLTNIEVVQRAYQSLGRCVLLQGELLKCHEKLNIEHVDLHNRCDEFALLDSVHSSCENKEKELLDQLKEMERERDDWRRTALKQVEKIQKLEDIKGKARTLENENVKLVAGLAQAKMEHHKLIREFVPEVVKKLHRSVEYKRSLAVHVGLCFTAGWLGGLSLGKTEDQVAAMLAETQNVDIKGSKEWQAKHQELFIVQYPFIQKVADSYRIIIDDLLKISPDVPPANVKPNPSTEANDGGRNSTFRRRFFPSESDLGEINWTLTTNESHFCLSSGRPVTDTRVESDEHFFYVGFKRLQDILRVTATQIIVNGDSVSPIASASAGAEGPIPPKTDEQKLASKNELKAKSTLMLAIPDEHLLKFYACVDEKSLWEAIKNRSLPSAWNNIALIMRNKSGLDTLSMDDLYNNLKVFESEIKGKSSSNSNSQNVAFVSSDNSSSTNETVNTAHSVSAASSKDQASTASYVDNVMVSFFANQSNAPQLDNEDLEQIDVDDLKEMDLKLQMAMLAMRVKRFIKKIGRKLDLNGKETVGFNKTKVECYNCHMRGHFARECRAPRNQGNRNRDNPRRNAPVDTSTTNALVVQDGIGGYDWSFQVKEGITNVALMAYTSQGSSSSSSSDSEVEGYHAVPPPYTGNYMPSRPDLSFVGLDDSDYKTKDTDSDNDSMFRPKSDQTKPKFTKSILSNLLQQSQDKYQLMLLSNALQRAAALISTAMPVNTAASKSKVNDALPILYSYCNAHSSVGRIFNQKSAAKTNNFNKKVNTTRVNNVTTVGPKELVSAAVRNGENVIKSSACWI
ncbi:ribonuclease H-like domain-containing protein [Tanacetum coccineum]